MWKVGVTMEVGSDGVAVIKISNPPVNALAPIRGLKDKGSPSALPNVSVEFLVNIVEGLALGGGLELALGCHACTSIPRVQLGFPELTLGVFPGFGGCACSSRHHLFSVALQMENSAQENRIHDRLERQRLRQRNRRQNMSEEHLSAHKERERLRRRDRRHQMIAEQ
ncbi:hypothetical protein IFM89_032087 [Coptis chinensis]|uniref:Uncharacterized protein n=1 Tax=Coptis chinensis TaxID=261450 RepID=A0A835I7I7_9MAGN|nr:hypothetical protein IFM89_032087 [Coptis chinensis]